VPGFQPAPHRWMVERSFAWIERNRRMGTGYEFLPSTSEAWIALSMIRLTRNGLAGERIEPAIYYRRAA
jgi:transposase